ncbi:MAG: ABC transporter ATP-binding protein [Myxococcota bacterium]
MTDAAIVATQISKVYGRGDLAFTAVDRASVSIARGEVAMLVGPSGSGKTTLLSVLGCVLEPTRGHLRLLGEDVVGLSPRRMARVRLEKIGFIFQGFNLIDALSARMNVALPLQVAGTSTRTALQRADALLETVGLASKLNSRPDALSGGQKQRVSIARALASNPPLILADEPTASLDARTGLEVTELMRALATERGATVLIVSHDERIFHLADRIIRIEDGRIQNTQGVDE